VFLPDRLISTSQEIDSEEHLRNDLFCVEWDVQELIRRWDSERELLRSAPGSYPNSLK